MIDPDNVPSVESEECLARFILQSSHIRRRDTEHLRHKMARVFKVRLTRYVDESGKRVKKDTPGARRIRERTKKWYGEYRDSRGITTRIPLSTDRAAAQAMLNEVIRKVERKKAGLHVPFDEHLRRSLTEHIDDFGRFRWPPMTPGPTVSTPVPQSINPCQSSG